MGSMLNNELICGKSLDDFLSAIEGFHGWKAPGLVIGGFMVDLCQTLIDKDVEADAIVESCHCLPDAIQIFTPCTVGNGWLKILDWDKFAITLYDRHTFKGNRVWLDLEKMRAFTDLYNWYMRLVPKKSLPLEVLLDSILKAKNSILSSSSVLLTSFHNREKKGSTSVCQSCGEAYASNQGETCFSCQGLGYYEIRS